MLFKNKLRWLDLGVFCGYVAAVFIAVAHHEPWADEAQAWLVARDLPYWKMMFSQMRYENSPGLWQTILWLAQHGFHAPYPAMNYIGAVLAAAGAGVLIFCAPFPRAVRYLMSSSYYVAYQYAVIARPYVMLLLLGGLAAIFYRRRAPIRLAIMIALLCGSSVHGAIMAAALFLGAAWHVLIKRDWPAESRGRYLAAAAIAVMAGIMLVVIVFPPADAGGEMLGIHKTTNFETFTDLLNHTTTEPWGIGVCLLLALIAFAARSGEPIVFVVSVGGLLAFEWFLVVLPQHLGAIVVALIVSLWIAWPQGKRWNPELTITSLVLGTVFAIQTMWAVSAWRNDYAAPYSGSKDAAIYIKQIGADHARIFGFCYPIVAIQAYFDHSIFANLPTAYLHATKNEEAGACVMQPQPNYDYVVTPVLQGDQDPYSAALLDRGYLPIHVSPGRAFFKQGIWIAETFVIYRRNF